MEIIPVIDLLKLPAENKKLLAACEEFGCLRVVNHGISTELLSKIKEVAESYFSLPDDVKHRGKNLYPGSRSVAHAELTPQLETLGVKISSSPADFDAFCDQLGVSAQDKEVIKCYAAAAYGLAADIASKIAGSMGVDGCSFEGWSGLLRPNIYRFTEGSVGSTGLVLHTDSGFLALLLQEDESVGGLEIMDRSGAFLAVDPVPGCLLVVLGDVAKVHRILESRPTSHFDLLTLKAWSNGRLRNVKHRVVCRKGAPRVTIPLFLQGPKDSMVEAPAELVDAEHPRLYETFDYENYRKLMISTNSYVGEALSPFAKRSS